MSDILGISSGAISAYQRALSTVSNNIANVNTEGYSRQDVVLKDSAPKKLASMYVGTGVMLQNIRRQYDQFAESNLRNSSSDLSAQTPMVDYTKRVMDIMGDKTIGLSSALDTFFASAGSLSADPASTVLRTSFLRSADGVASRFSELSGQLDQISTETRQGLESVASEVNSLTSQLGLINQSLSRAPSVDTQPAELLDQRDLTLRKLSELVRIKVSYATNGAVNVSLGSTMTQGLVVDGQKVHPIGVDASVKDKIEFLLDPYGKTEPLPSLGGGKLGGYQTFITQVLQPAQKSLNGLATVFVKETNAIQKNGIDGYGQLGQDLFRISDQAAQEAAGISLAVSDGMRVATAAQFRVSEGNTNVTTTRASVRYAGTTPTAALSNNKIVNNPNPSAGVTFKVDGAREYVPVTSLSAGVDATFYIDNMAPGQQLQVMTREGRQLLGKALTETEKYQLMVPANGFSSGLNYSDQYLNQSGSDAYRGLDLFYGAKADVLYQPNFDRNGAAMPSTALPAKFTTARLTNSTVGIDPGAIRISGVDLPAYAPLNDSRATIAGLTKGSDPDFSHLSFNLKLGEGPVLTVGDTPATVLTATNLVDLASALQTSLRIQDGNSTNITVQVAENGQDLVVADSLRRDISSIGFTLSPAAAQAGANAGDVVVHSEATQIADWFNGKSKATISSLSFGLGTPGFSDFSMSLGGVDYRLKFPTASNPRNLKDLATYLQTELRRVDGSNSISVTSDSLSLMIKDRAGRALQSVKLTPNPNAVDANGGTVSIDNSVLSKTNVRAEAFSEIRVPLGQLDLNKNLKINGVLIPTKGVLDANGMVSIINASSAGVHATIGVDNQLVIQNTCDSSITIDSLPTGNALSMDAGVYGAQVRLVQLAPSIRVPATEIDLEKPLQINGITLNPGVVAYSLPAPDQALTVQFGALSFSDTSPAKLATALNADATFNANYVASITPTGKLLIRDTSGQVRDKAVADVFQVSTSAGTVDAQYGLADRDALVERLKDFSALTGVTGSIDMYGDLQLSVLDPTASRAISIGPGKTKDGSYAQNALGLEPLDYDVDKRLRQLLTEHPEEKDVRITFGDKGQPSDLARVGLRTAAYIEKGCPDDLLVFVTGKGSANVSASFSGKPDDPRQSLRSQSLLVKFTADNRYNIIDNKTGTVLADRFYDPSVLEPVIEFEGLRIQLNHAPSVGDSYTIDGNQDGIGNNVNMLDMVDLAKKSVSNGKTLGNAYVDQINNVGNLAQQAKITQSALKVVNDQAVAARDKVSGVNLDEEAASLVRYQQAYQAAAKALQVSGQLFDAIVKI